MQTQNINLLIITNLFIKSSSINICNNFIFDILPQMFSFVTFEKKNYRQIGQIFPLMCEADKVWITELTLIHKNIKVSS